MLCNYDMLTINRDSTITGFGTLGIRDNSQPSDGPKRRKLNSDGQSWVQRSGKEVD